MEVKKMRACSACGGQGKQRCQRCGGTGKEHIPITDEEVPCTNPDCQNGYVICQSCNGAGQETYTEIVPDPPKPEPEPVKPEPKLVKPEPESTSPSNVSANPNGKVIGGCVVAGFILGIAIGHPFIGLIVGLCLGGYISSKKSQ